MTTEAIGGLLYPQQNLHRNRLDLSGLWEFQLDPNEIGERERWFDALPNPRFIPVPGNWNDLFDDAKNYLGLAWHRLEIIVPVAWRGQRVWLRVGSANYTAKVWVNGFLVTEHFGGHLPFVADVTEALLWDKPNIIAIAVENHPLPERVPAGPTPAEGIFSGPFTTHPATTYDFFPYAGLHRAVHLFSTPETHIADLTVLTSIEGQDGIVEVIVRTSADASGQVDLEGQRVTFSTTKLKTTVRLRVASARFWEPADPHLYSLTVELQRGEAVTDSYRLQIGIRTVEVGKNAILLNGKPIHLKGYGRHEDAPISGRSTNLNAIARDFELMRWTGANSFRAAHYPHSEETAQLADKLGILIIAEIPAVSYNFGDSDTLIEARFGQCQVQLEELIQRDKNHPSVIAWNIANEPLIGGTSNDSREHATQIGVKLFTALYQQAKTHDPTRPVTLVGEINGPRAWLNITDFVSINRYYGWYTHGGQIEAGVAALERELDELHAQFGKPILFTEFGADTVAGLHNHPSEMWTEEYQTEFLQAYLKLGDRKPYVVGMQLWVFADFKTGQGLFRVGGLNHKGVFTRDRRPKMAAHLLRSHWKRD